MLVELRALSQLHKSTGSLLYQDWQRFAISCGIFSDRMLKKSASFVLASFRPSTYPEGTLRIFTRCGLAGRPF
ncbi:MAG: hypothetical protein CAF45_012980 [Nitrospira sp. CG24E]|nr:MAG: hypothetical protein CAF45_012980 [Nitrospira sp. CG24E]